jgi:type II secretory pathway predicted ATPase ExeA
MYQSYWQLKHKPFENTTDPRFYYPAETHQAALLKLRYAIENRRGGALLAGVSGSGKTLVVQMLRQLLDESFTPFVHLVFPQMSTGELLAYLADKLDGSQAAAADSSVPQSICRIEQLLADSDRPPRHAVVIVDEAHLIRTTHTLEALRLLMNLESSGQPGLTLVLVGQTGLLPTMERMPQLEERLAVKCLLRPFAEQETAEYVTHRLQVAGTQRTIFEPDSLPVLHSLSGGVARRINRLCDLALLIGFAEERQTIDAAHFEAVAQELVAVVPE